MKSKIFLISHHPNITVLVKSALEENGYFVKLDGDSDLRRKKPRIEDVNLVIEFYKVNQNNTKNFSNESLIVKAVFIQKSQNYKDRIQISKECIYNFSVQKNDTDKFICTVNELLENGLYRRGVFDIREKEYRKDTGKHSVNNIIGQSPKISEIRKRIRKMCIKPNLPVLITGDTGTGKELVSNILHYSSSRADKPLIIINCSAIPENLVESQLFGHKKGAFTGANSDYHGLFKQADGGTILLDEIGDMNLKLQPKLLRFLENQSFYCVGSTRETRVDVWIMASTNASLSGLIEKKLFRKDLFYRLSVLQIELPPLWERKQDIPLLIKEFLKQEGASSLRFSPESMRIIFSYNWPGNVRELKNVVRCLSHNMKSGLVLPEDLPRELRKSVRNKVQNCTINTLAEMEREYIINMYKENLYQIRPTARVLGISRNTLRRKLDNYGILTDSNA